MISPVPGQQVWTFHPWSVEDNQAGGITVTTNPCIVCNVIEAWQVEAGMAPLLNVHSWMREILQDYGEAAFLQALAVSG